MVLRIPEFATLTLELLINIIRDVLQTSRDIVIPILARGDRFLFQKEQFSFEIGNSLLKIIGVHVSFVPAEGSENVFSFNTRFLDCTNLWRELPGMGRE